MGRSFSRRIAIPLVLTLALGLVGIQTAQAASGAYTALGDSYSSGVGSRTYYADSGSCQRSPYAYPVLAAQRTGTQLTFVACSGARVADVQNGQLGSLSAATRYVTVSAGGNDAGFGSVISACARPWPYTCWTEINNANSFITNTLPGRLDGLYNDIRGRAPTATVIVVGYPRIFDGQECNLLARISSGEQTELNKTADLLATTIAARAAAHGFGFVDPRQAFTGHAVCDNPEWINGLSNPTSESYHPNQTGQSAGYTPLVVGRMTT
ncbi:SGNH/GDSL hydrolase family protein [Actinocrispum wychmicini]|uniref:GDSL-like lipase/acylhydrolase family protein n=1 Tax=Actinocrispum wychmicini TaxID=1213861 RepID=A0A4R2JDI5_9PSEU|nr:SGNH/GDSL hydrolase family protein [Actinocrispum wychmicini]TCO54249.1 GDSL-like lipase/acylhydrolase family protein [Actinocrispum wychmicini]